MTRKEFVTRGNSDPAMQLGGGVAIRMFASAALGAEGLTTCSATFQSGSQIPYHTHPTSEVITAAIGEAEALIEGRRYRLAPYDAIHVPAGVAHAVRNVAAGVIVMHTCFPTGAPEREFVDDRFGIVDCDDSAGHPENLVRGSRAERYELSPQTEFRDLFAARLGSAGLCGGYGRVQPGASLPYHRLDGDGTITIVEGRGLCQVAGKEYELAEFDTVCVPKGWPHRLINPGDKPMAMIWVYASDEPVREFVQ